MKGIHMPIRRIAFTLTAWTLGLSACGGGGAKPPKSEPPQPPTLALQIDTLEKDGKLPKLDRSSDIKGPDRDNNGIRDDIDAWIAAQPITEVQKKAAQQMAKVQQAKLMADLNDKVALQVLGDGSMAGVKCLRLSFMPDYQRGYDLSSQLEAMMANTKERAKQYIAYNRARSGSVTELPSGNTCEP